MRVHAPSPDIFHACLLQKMHSIRIGAFLLICNFSFKRSRIKKNPLLSARMLYKRTVTEKLLSFYITPRRMRQDILLMYNNRNFTLFTTIAKRDRVAHERFYGRSMFYRLTRRPLYSQLLPRQILLNESICLNDASYGIPH